MNIALVRTSEKLNDGGIRHSIIGLYFFATDVDLARAVNETDNPEDCEYLLLNMSSAAIHVRCDYSSLVEEKFIDFLNGSGHSDEGDPPPAPIDFLELSKDGERGLTNVSEEFFEAYANALTEGDGWQPVKEPEVE